MRKSEYCAKVLSLFFYCTSIEPDFLVIKKLKINLSNSSSSFECLSKFFFGLWIPFHSVQSLCLIFFMGTLFGPLETDLWIIQV